MASDDRTPDGIAKAKFVRPGFRCYISDAGALPGVLARFRFRVAGWSLLDAVVAEDARIYKDPAPQVVIQELSDNGVVLAIRPFVKLQDYWLVRADLVERAKLRFDAEGISLALPRQEVHLFEHAARSFEGRPA